MYIFAFGNRFSASKFSSLLTRNGIANTLINTPKETHIGCGLAVRVDAANLGYARAIFARNRFDAYLGLYRVEKVRGKITTYKL